MRLRGSPGLSPAPEASARPLFEPVPNTEEVTREAGRPMGDWDREPGGDRVDAYREAADGCDRRCGRLISDWESEEASLRVWRVFWTVKAGAITGDVGSDPLPVGES